MIARYRQVDFQGIHVQTHATLSACRGILRMYELEHNPAHLALVKKVFGLYQRVAWTDVFGNYNWFGIPKWTEPCGIIDSYILATHLWQLTGQPKWLADAHYIYHNAMAHAQRATGAFGTDTCVGPAGAVLAPITYEVTWCCTMRGAEGLTRAARSLFFVDGASVFLPFYSDCDATLKVGRGTVSLSERTTFPAEGSVDLTVTGCTVRTPLTLCFYIPQGTSGTPRITLNGKPARVTKRKGFAAVTLRLRAGDRIGFAAKLSLWTRESSMPANGAQHAQFFHGPSVLGCEETHAPSLRGPRDLEPSGEGTYRVAGNGAVLRPLWDVRRLTREDSRTRVVF
jgi:hypothetical protein